MLTLMKWLYLLALIVWLGEIIFFSFIAAPTIFATFPTADAGRAVGAIFPTYYRIGYVCGAFLVAGTVVLLSTAVSRGWWSVNLALAAVMLALTLYAGMRVQPRAAALRPQIHETTAPAEVKDEFNRLHRTAVILNGVVLLCGLAVSVITAASVRP